MTAQTNALGAEQAANAAKGRPSTGDVSQRWGGTFPQPRAYGDLAPSQPAPAAYDVPVDRAQVLGRAPHRPATGEPARCSGDTAQMIADTE